MARELITVRQWKDLREIAFERDRYTCVYCNSSDRALSLDHVIPFAHGGTDELDNLVTACRSCNSSKGNRTPEQWRSKEKVPVMNCYKIIRFNINPKVYLKLKELEKIILDLSKSGISLNQFCEACKIKRHMIIFWRKYHKRKPIELKEMYYVRIITAYKTLKRAKA